MPRVHHVKKARKDNPAVKKGEPYYWWKFNFGAKHYSSTYPRRSQLTRSSFFAQLYDLEDRLAGLTADSPEDLASALGDLASEVRDLGYECQSNLDNMPEGLQEGSDSGQLLQKRMDYCEEMAEEFDRIAMELEDESEDESEEDKDTRVQNALTDAQSVEYQGS